VSGAHGLVNAWPVPVYERTASAGEVNSLNGRLADAILAREKTGLSTPVGTVGAWKSRPDFFRWSELSSEIAVLQGWILDGAGALIGHISNASAAADAPMFIEGWAVVYRAGAYHKPHGHHDSAWSGVYYVTTSEGSGSSEGAMELFDPRVAAHAHEGEAWEGTYQVNPEPGMLIVFPSWLQHWVRPVGGNSARICVAFNIGYWQRP
jgi:uncharacterized protein (TIGR02466 family)